MPFYPVKIFACRQSIDLAKSIAAHYGAPLEATSVDPFKDGEFRVALEASVREAHTFIIGSTFQPTDNLLELLLMIDAAKRSSAHSVTAVIPYFGWSRQDRSDRPRVSIGAKLVTQVLESAGANRVISMDLHVEQIQGFFSIHFDHIYASPIFLDYIKALSLPDLVIATPDMGGSKRALAYAKHLGSEVAVCYKQRSQSNQVGSMQVMGAVEGKHLVIVDDIVDTAGTLAKCAELMVQQGAKTVRAICSHAVLSGPALKNIENSPLEELIVTDSIPLKQPHPKVKVLSCGHLIARIMKKINDGDSISSEFLV